MFLLAACCLWAAGPLGASGQQAQSLPADPPVAPQPLPGSVKGTIDKPLQVKAIALVSRQMGTRHEPAAWDARTGEFTFEKLPGDAAYDLAITLKNGQRIEGIDLGFVDERLERLAARRREQLGLAARETRQFAAADAAQLLDYVREVKDFMDIRRVLYVRGEGSKATMLVELMRARDFHARKDEQVIWRVELWYFEYRSGGWQRLANQERVLERLRAPPEQWQKVAIEYRPELSVRVDEKGASEPMNVKLPEKVDASRGRQAQTEPDIKTQPNIIGGAASADLDDDVKLQRGVEGQLGGAQGAASMPAGRAENIAQ